MKIRVRSEEARTVRRIFRFLLLSAAFPILAYSTSQIVAAHIVPQKSLEDLPWYCLNATDTQRKTYTRGSTIPLSVPYLSVARQLRISEDNRVIPYSLQCGMTWMPLLQPSTDWNWKLAKDRSSWGTHVNNAGYFARINLASARKDLETENYPVNSSAWAWTHSFLGEQIEIAARDEVGAAAQRMLKQALQHIDLALTAPLANFNQRQRGLSLVVRDLIVHRLAELRTN